MNSQTAVGYDVVSEHTVGKVDQAEALVRGGVLQALHPQLRGSVGMAPVSIGERGVVRGVVHVRGTYGT